LIRSCSDCASWFQVGSGVNRRTLTLEVVLLAGLSASEGGCGRVDRRVQCQWMRGRGSAAGFVVVASRRRCCCVASLVGPLSLMSPADGDDAGSESTPSYCSPSTAN